MKNTFLLFILFSGLLFSQELKFEEVVQAEGLSAKQLYDNAILWAANNYKSSNDVIQVKDSENFIILGKGSYKYKPDFFMAHVPAIGWIRHTFKISCKDGRYKYEIYDFEHEGSNNSYGQNGTIGILNDGEKYTGSSKALDKGYRNRTNRDAVKQSKQFVELTVSSLKKDMIKANHKNENW
ncbi:DUF4468 domain-containing protein [Chryseobacterium zhengzhouense]|uniref:DUF4468 domain-containing protein n=1 Tax=Chryseobacterium zhengzhouense TaxID=1636086 RepID=A0ABW2M1K0_9FLAO